MKFNVLFLVFLSFLALHTSAQLPLQIGFEDFDSSYACNEFVSESLSLPIPHYNDFYNHYAQRKRLKAIVEVDNVKVKSHPKDKVWYQGIRVFKNGCLTDEIGIEHRKLPDKRGIIKYRTDTIDNIHFNYSNNNLKIEKTVVKHKTDSDTSGFKSCYYFNKQKTIDSIIDKKSKTVFVYNNFNRIEEIFLYERGQLKSRKTFIYEKVNFDNISVFEEFKSKCNYLKEMNFLKTELKNTVYNCLKVTVIQFSDFSKTDTSIIYSFLSKDFTFLYFKRVDSKDSKYNKMISNDRILFFKSKNGVISNLTQFERSKNGYDLNNYQLKGDDFESLKISKYNPMMDYEYRSKFSKDLKKRIEFGHSKKNGLYYKLIR